MVAPLANAMRPSRQKYVTQLEQSDDADGGAGVEAEAEADGAG